MSTNVRVCCGEIRDIMTRRNVDTGVREQMERIMARFQRGYLDASFIRDQFKRADAVGEKEVQSLAHEITTARPEAWFEPFEPK